MSKNIDLPPFMERHRILSLDVAAKVLGFSTDHLRRMYRTGKIPQPIRIGARKLGYPAGLIIDLTAASKRESS